MNGSNPMRWNCNASGCFNEKRRPKIETFAECFPRRINFGDVDGLVELGGFLCLLEWKGPGGSLKRGQILTFTSITRPPGNIVFVAEGDAEAMTVGRYCLFWGGAQFPWVSADLSALKARIRRWANWVESGQPPRLQSVKGDAAA